MRYLSDYEIRKYVESGAPMDKAGAYAVQDKCAGLAEVVEGCYLNVVGLPLCEVITLLERFPTNTQLRSGWQPPTECVDCALSERIEVHTT